MSQVFGLGIVLNFVDNASSGMSGATSVFMNMSDQMNRASNATNDALTKLAQGTALITAGNGLINFGKGATGMLQNVLGKVQAVGSEFQSFKITLAQLFGGEAEAEKQIASLMDFSVKSPFEVEDTKDLLILLKSQGIDAFKSIRGEISGTEQQTLQWISDLMAFKPEVPVSRWKLAFQNYVGSGESKVLRNILDMGAIPKILGHDVSKTVEGRLNDIIEIVEKKNLTGLTNNLFGTMQQNLANIEDFFTMAYKAIADAGVFDNLAQIISIATGTLEKFSIESGKLPAIAEVLAGAFNALLEPIVSLTKKVAELTEKFVDFSITHPELAQIVIVLTALTGASAIAFGWILKLSGSLLTLGASIKLLGGFSNVFKLIGTGLGTLGGSILAIVPLSIILYQAWKNNFMGIQDFVKTTTQKVSLLMSYFRNGGFTVEEQDLADKLGLNDTIQKIEILKQKWDSFKTGFSEGFNEAFENIFTRLEGILNSFGSTTGETVKNILPDDGSLEDIEASGKAIGGLAVNLLFLITVINTAKTTFKALGTVWGIISGIFNGAVALFTNIGTIFSTLGGFFSTVGGILSTIGSAIMGVLTAIAGALGISVGWVIVIIATIIAAIVAVVVFWDEICNFFTVTLPNAIMYAVNVVGQFFTDLINKIMSNPVVQVIVAKVTEIINKIKEVVTNIKNTIVGIFNNVITVVTPFISVIVNVIKTIVNTVILIATTIWGVISTVGITIFSVIRVIVTTIIGIIKTVVTVIVGIATTIWNIIQLIGSAIRFVVLGILAVIKWVITGIINVVTAIWNWLMTNIFAPIANFFMQYVIGPIMNAINQVIIFIQNVLNQIWSIIEPFVNRVAEIFGQVADKIKTAWDSVRSFFSGIFDEIKTFAETCCTAITSAFGVVIDKIKGAFDWLNNLVGKAKDFLDNSGNKLGKFIGLPGFATGVDNFAGGLAVINERGGEIVDLPQGTRVIPHDESVRESLKDGVKIGINALAGKIVNQKPVVTAIPNTNNLSKQDINYLSRSLNQGNSNTPQEGNTNNNYDYSVTFSAGSIVLQVPQGGTEEDYKKMAEYIMKYIQRTQQKKSMAMRV